MLRACHIPQEAEVVVSHRHRWLEPTLLVLILAVGSYARTEAVEDYIQDRPDPFERLVGDEPGYQYLAERWAYGESLDWPARMPWTCG